MRKCANISPYMRRPLVIYDFATAPFWISLYMRKILFYFLSVCLSQSLLPLNLSPFLFSLFWISVSVCLLFFYVSLCISVSLCFILLSQLLQSLSVSFFAWFLFGSRKERCVKGRNIEEGRGNRRHFRLFKFIPGCVQRHFPPVTISILYVGKGFVGLCLRQYYTVGLLHSVWDQIQSIQYCLATPRQKCMRGGGGGGGLRKINSCRKVLLQVTFMTRRNLHCLLWVLSFYGKEGAV